ncbi:flagellar hook-length control protein FliK [Motiliproteus coralliicola]|uniref:flagellar hook-length control protein FliK n=1 Tax=Motiliproteus coralliicola TaxID=2283196 RepID=UPI001058BEEB|nr:flagellar hook-length control protein FliK [Motiliproteus coralliicola]
MVDQLNNANRQAQPSEAAAGLRRLEALLSIGQSRTGQVVQVTPQPLPAATTPQGGAQQPAGAATSQPAAPTQSQPGAQTPAASNPASPAAPAGSATTGQAPTTGTTGTTTTAQQSSYLIQVRIEGRLYELLTQRPIDPGTRVQVSRDAGGQISLQLGSAPATSTPNPASSGHSANPAPANPSQGPASAQAQPQASTRSAGQPATPNAAPQAGTTNAPATTAGRAAVATATAPSATTQLATPTARDAVTASTLPSNTAQQPTSSPTTARSDSGSATLERVNLQLQRGQVPTGQRLQAEVISARALPQATPPAQPSASAQAPLVNGSPRAAAPAAGSPPATPAGPASQPAQPPQNHLLRVRVEGRTLELVSPRTIEPGTRIQIQQRADGRLSTELPNLRTRSIEQALRENLPQQQVPAPLLNLLSGAQASGQLQQAKPVLLDLVQILLGRSLPNPQQADAETVRQQVQNSGTLLENKLARGDTQNLNQDHKALLLKLSDQLNQGGSQRELPASLSDRISQLTQQALSRVLVNQLTSAAPQLQEGGSEANRTLALDIPVMWQGKTENLQLQIRRDDGSAVETPQGMSYRWQVRLNFEINQTERLQAELTLEAERISVIWSGDQQIRRLVEQQLDKLGERFERIGLDVKTLGVRDETAQPEPTVKPPRSRLIDIKT